MKKELIRFCLIYFLAAWVGYFGIHFLLVKNSGHDFDLLGKSITAVIFSTVMTLLPISTAYSIIPRSKYLESNDIEKPSFEVFCSTAVDIPQGFDFSRLKTEIGGKWIITFSDDTEKVLKCRTKLNFSRWGSAAWMKYDDSTGKIHLECFPMSWMHVNNDIDKKMQKEIENCLEQSKQIC